MGHKLTKEIPKDSISLFLRNVYKHHFKLPTTLILKIAKHSNDVRSTKPKVTLISNKKPESARICSTWYKNKNIYIPEPYET